MAKIGQQIYLHSHIKYGKQWPRPDDERWLHQPVLHQRFKGSQIIQSASVASDRGGNERAVNVSKRCGAMKRGFKAGMDAKMFQDTWITWTFQSNFMYNSVLWIKNQFINSHLMTLICCVTAFVLSLSCVYNIIPHAIHHKIRQRHIWHRIARTGHDFFQMHWSVPGNRLTG